MIYLALLAILIPLSAAHASEEVDQTIGLFVSGTETYPAYTLLAPIGSTDSYLIDSWGRVVHTWASDHRPGLATYLLENGDLLRTGSLGGGAGSGGLVLQISWDGTLIWEFDYTFGGNLPHHDIEPLPNGNVLILAWEDKTDTEAIAAGYDPAFLLFPTISPVHIVEVERTGPTSGSIVWEWHVWDHLIQDFDSTKANYGVVADHSELIDANFLGTSPEDWLHCNGIDYNADLDQIVLSVRNFSELWVIDHSTTTAEAASHTGGAGGMGGDILYRWGNPQAYRAGDDSDQRLFGQHDVQWVPDGYPGAGDFTVYNNGTGRPGGNYSSVDEIIPVVNGDGSYPRPASGTPFDPADVAWSYSGTPPEDWYESGLGGAEKLPNGNMLICIGQSGEFVEVTPDQHITWRYINPLDAGVPQKQGDPAPANNVFRCTQYAEDYPAFAGRTLTPETSLEIYPITIDGTAHVPVEPGLSDSVLVTTGVAADAAINTVEVYADTGAGFFATAAFDDGDHGDGAAGDGVFGAAIPALLHSGTVPYYVYAEDVSASIVTDPPNPPSTVYYYTVSCSCPSQADADDDTFITAIDLSACIDILFASAPDVQDAACPAPRFDLDCDGFSTALDLTVLIDHLFANGPGACDPCQSGTQ